MRIHVSILAVCALLMGCNYGKRNVQACEDWVQTMDSKFAGTACEGADFSLLLTGGCATYEDTKCDISDYFTCLEEQSECSEESGELNTEGWTNCVQDASCE
ncbi:MAG: hypothetical protein CL927_06725 [Deltaproteobacteria bacterium]|nr:hypothetical protein [Deltaproteobacteria bacterium]HCH65043.1 hypothetical protein [Deltaproteobacteria bacterium]